MSQNSARSGLSEYEWQIEIAVRMKERVCQKYRRFFERRHDGPAGPGVIQPMAAEDVAAAVGRAAVDFPVNEIVEVAGPEQFRLDVSSR